MVNCDICKKNIEKGEKYTSVLEKDGKVQNYCDDCYKEKKKNNVRAIMASAAEAIINLFYEELE